MESPLCGDDNWVANLLGLGSGELASVSGSGQSVAAEVDAYLLDPMTSEAPIVYWQVCPCTYCRTP